MKTSSSEREIEPKSERLARYTCKYVDRQTIQSHSELRTLQIRYSKMAPPDVPFSSRFSNIMAIAKHLSSQGQDGGIAKTNATQVEGQFFEAADTQSEYQELCDNYMYAHGNLSSAVPTTQDAAESKGDSSDGVEPREVFNEEGPRFGRYEWATFHADGVTSTIYKARPTATDKGREDGRARTVVALKVMMVDHLQAPHNAQKEVRVLERCRSEAAHIVPLLDSFQQPGGKLVLVFPFLRQDLENLLRSGRLSQRQSGMVFLGLFGALAHLHGLGIIHRDIKPGNILLESMEGPVYLIDFGIAWDPQDPDSEPADRKMTDVSTTCYRPPEILFGCRNYDMAFDMWGAGCVVAEMVTKHHYQLFDGGAVGSELGLIKSIFSTLGTPTDEIWPSATGYPDWGKVKFQDFPSKAWNDILPGVSEAARNFISRTVCYEPTKRMTAREALNHALAKELR